MLDFFCHLGLQTCAYEWKTVVQFGCWGEGSAYKCQVAVLYGLVLKDRLLDLD